MRRSRVIFIDMEYDFSGVSTGMRVRWTRQGDPLNGSVYVICSLYSLSKYGLNYTFPFHREDGPAFSYTDWHYPQVRTMHANYINGGKKFTNKVWAWLQIC